LHAHIAAMAIVRADVAPLETDSSRPVASFCCAIPYRARGRGGEDKYRTNLSPLAFAGLLPSAYMPAIFIPSLVAISPSNLHRLRLSGRLGKGGENAALVV